jgi:hypothetical protein
MIADRSYSPGLSAHQRASLFYFAAAVPTVGFVHGAADLSPFEGSLASDVESGLMERGPSIEAAAGRKGAHASSAKPWALSPGWLS